MSDIAQRKFSSASTRDKANPNRNDSVECAVCHNTYHMNCVRPPLLKKPSRGFAWACGPCSRAQEKKLEARLGTTHEDAEEEEIIDEEEEEASGDTNATTPDLDSQIDTHPATQAEIALAKMWPMRYLGIHCRVEDALQYDDRAIYPRASSRLGPRHQANVNVWHGARPGWPGSTPGRRADGELPGRGVPHLRHRVRAHLPGPGAVSAPAPGPTTALAARVRVSLRAGVSRPSWSWPRT